MPLRRAQLDPRDMKAAYVVSDENGYYDSQNIISVWDKSLGQWVLSCVLHHSRNHEGGAGLTLCSTRSEEDNYNGQNLKELGLGLRLDSELKLGQWTGVGPGALSGR